MIPMPKESTSSRAAIHPARQQVSPCQRYRKQRQHHRQDRHHRTPRAGGSKVALPPDRAAQVILRLPFLAAQPKTGLSPPKARIVCQRAHSLFRVAKTRWASHPTGWAHSPGSTPDRYARWGSPACSQGDRLSIVYVPLDTLSHLT